MPVPLFAMVVPCIHARVRAVPIAAQYSIRDPRFCLANLAQTLHGTAVGTTWQVKRPLDRLSAKRPNLFLEIFGRTL